MQSIGHGTWPTEDLLLSGRLLGFDLNSIIRTNAFVFYGIIAQNASLGPKIIYLIIIINAFNHVFSYLLTLQILKFLIRGKSIPKIAIIFTFLSFSLGTPWSLIMWISSNFDPNLNIDVAIVEIVTSDKKCILRIPGLSRDSLMLAFHHNAAYNVFLFFILLYLIFFDKNKQRSVNINESVLIMPNRKLLEFFFVLFFIAYLSLTHLGIAIHFLIPMFIFLFVTTTIDKGNFNGRRVVLSSFILTIISLIIIYFVQYIYFLPKIYKISFKLIEIHLLLLIVKDLLIYYNTYLLFGFLGLIEIFKALNKKDDNYCRVYILLLILFFFQFLELLFFNFYRIIGKQIYFMDYFPWFSFHITTTIISGVFLGTHPIKLKTLIFKKDSLKQIKMRKYRLLRVTACIAVLLLLLNVLDAAINICVIFSTNIGKFYYEHYGRAILVDKYELSAYNWIYYNTPVDSVFLASIDNWELAALAGRALVYAGYRINKTYERYIDVVNFFTSSNESFLLHIIKKYNVSYVFITTEDVKKYGNSTLNILLNSSFFELDFYNKETFVFRYKYLQHV